MLKNEEIVDLYLIKKLTCFDISKIDGRSTTTVYKILLQNNVKLRNKSESNKLFPDEILIRLYNIGLSCYQIGNILGINSSTVSKRFNKINFPTRTKSQSKKIGYSQEEFKRFFLDNNIVGQIIENI